MKRKWFRYWKHVTVALLIILAGLLYYLSGWRSDDEYLISADDASITDSAGAEDRDEPETEPEQTGPPQCYVYVCGEVINPGVYVLDEGARLFEAVDLAGGFSENAAQEALNLALPIADGMKIDVPDKEKAAAYPSENFISGTGSWQNEKININTAGKEQLMTLNGIGASRAEAIIAYRKEHGAFASIEDIMQVSGIKEAAFAKIKDDIVVR